MSALCHNQTHATQQGYSRTAANHTRLFDNLVGALQKRLWNRQPDRLGGCGIEDEIEFRRLLDRDIAGLLPIEGAGQSRCFSIVQVKISGRLLCQFQELSNHR